MFVSPQYRWISLTLIIIWAILDYVDGDLARQTKSQTVSMWFDPVGDIILQNIIMAGIAIGAYSQIGIELILIYFISNSGLNLISIYYNNTFGFDSYKGSSLFRKYMETKPTYLNRFLKNLIDPTSSALGIFFFTIRYWIAIGALRGNLAGPFIIIAYLTLFRWISMLILYGLHLQKYKKLWVLQALAIIDEDREEFYKVRGAK